MNTFKRCLLTSAASAAAMIAPLCAQISERRATFTGGGEDDRGKCTIEVYVNGSADVEIRGDRGFLRTLSGRPAQWRRFVCSGPVPTNPSEFRFSGIDGRGTQELTQEPRGNRGVAVVRIQDSREGGEGYTFDLEWRGQGSGSSPTGRSFGRDRDRGPSANESARACQDAVREKANRQFGLRDIELRNPNADDNPGRNDAIVGFFDVRRGDYRDTYRFSCAINPGSGRIRDVEISQERGAAADRIAGRDDATSACERAAEERMRQDGFRNARFGWPDSDNRRNNTIAGTVTAQRGDSGRSYEFDIQCSVNLENGNVQSVQVEHR